MTWMVGVGCYVAGWFWGPKVWSWVSGMWSTKVTPPKK